MDLVFRLVLFHDSVESIAKYPSKIMLNEVQKYQYLDPDFYKVLTVLMIADSRSYTIISTKTSTEFREEYLRTQSTLIE